MKINMLDLFSGTGGFSKGLTEAGFEIENHYFSEVDKHAIANYRHNFPGAQYAGSVTDVRGRDLGRIDAITFGSPCQDFSLAGNRSGLGGDRSSLIRHAIRLIRECRPKFFVWENVKGVFSTNDGADFAAILQAFADIGGYRLEWQLLNTAWFLPQNRERIYLVGLLGEGSGRALFSDIENISRSNKGARQTANCITAGGNSGGLRSQMTLIKIKSATKSGYELAHPGDSINFSVPNSKTRRGRVGKQQSQTLDTQCNQGVWDGYRLRRLTERECERLQGFPSSEIDLEFDLCLDHQKNYVHVGVQSPKLQKRALSVENAQKKETARFAEHDSNTKNQQIKRLAPEIVLINLEEGIAVLPKTLRLKSNVNGVVQLKELVHPTIIEDFALLIALINLTLEKETHHGKVELHMKEQNLTHLRSSKKQGKLFGKETMQLVNGVLSDLTTPKKHLKCIISSRLAVLSSEQSLAILSCFATHFIGGFTQEKTKIENLYKIKFIKNCGWTQFGNYDGEVKEISATQRYKMCGNAVTVPVVKYVGEQILRVIA